MGVDDFELKLAVFSISNAFSRGGDHFKLLYPFCFFGRKNQRKSNLTTDN
jgi:hypothetical protein